jgi:hypothetical protein
MTLKSFRVNFIACVLIVFFMAGCAPTANTVVKLSRDRYNPNINFEEYKTYSGKTILFSSIIDKSGTSNLAYYNPEKTVGYQLYYTSSAFVNQPVISFFWYALQKGFESAGIDIETSGPVYDAELTIIFKSLTDKEIQFDALGTKMGRLLYKKHCVVRTPDVTTTDTTVLEKRAYGMIDSMVKAILDDPDFKKIFSRGVI